MHALWLDGQVLGAWPRRAAVLCVPLAAAAVPGPLGIRRLPPPAGAATVMMMVMIMIMMVVGGDYDDGDDDAAMLRLTSRVLPLLTFPPLALALALAASR
jgi:hypothetical protein